MNENLLNALQYHGAAAGVVAALVVSLDLGRGPTGWAFAVFVTSSIALIAWRFLQKDSEGIGWQNCGLLLINLIGVYRSSSARRRPEASARRLCAYRTTC
jgi:hypothetical protein